MRGQSKIEFVYFDMGNTLFSFDEYYDAASKEFGQPVEKVRRLFVGGDDERCKGILSLDEIDRVFREQLEVPDDFKQKIDEYFAGFFRPIKVTHGLVNQLQGLYRLGLLTNIWGRLFKFAMASGCLPDVEWDVVIKSDEIKMIKPDRGIFELATERAGVEKKNILFTDDRVVNVEAAERFGWQAVLFETDMPEKSVAKIRQLLGL